MGSPIVSYLEALYKGYTVKVSRSKATCHVFLATNKWSKDE